MRRLRIQWDNPISIEEALKLNDEDNDYGLYQIYGQHIVFGSDSLLYIGMARDQTFGKRFSQHEANWLSDENNVSIRVGRLSPDDYNEDRQWKDWSDLLSHSEALLIYWHSPPYNSMHLNEYQGQPLHIQNWGNRGSMLPECTSDWQPSRPDDKND